MVVNNTDERPWLFDVHQENRRLSFSASFVVIYDSDVLDLDLDLGLRYISEVQVMLCYNLKKYSKDSQPTLQNMIQFRKELCN